MWYLKTARKTQVTEFIWTHKDEFNVLRSQAIEAKPALRMGAFGRLQNQARDPSRNSAKGPKQQVNQAAFFLSSPAPITTKPSLPSRKTTRAPLKQVQVHPIHFCSSYQIRKMPLATIRDGDSNPF